MPTSTYLSNPVVLIGASSAATTDITDQVSAVTVNYVVEALEDTAFASSESYALLSVLVGTKCYIKVTPAAGANTATNPGFELTNTFLSALPVVNANLGELSTYDIELVGGSYTVDVT